MNDMEMKTNTTTPRIAIVHDFLLYPGGAERVLDDMITMFPNAPVYTLLYDQEKMGDRYKSVDVRPSFLQKFPKFLRKRYTFLLPFFGTAVESFDLRDFDVIISSSGAWSKGIVTRLDTTHVAYIHSPMRYVWDENEHYLRKLQHKRPGFCTRAVLSYLRIWDHQAAQRPDIVIANSQYTADRIAKYYRRDARIVYPAVTCPYDVKHLIPMKKDPYFLVISRLSKYKNVALAIETCNKLQLDLVVIGEGREMSSMQKIAGEHVTLIGWADEKTKWRYLKNARALLFPTEDDFGIVCAEALCVETPVIALNRGGAREIIEKGKTGELFDAPTVEMMADGIRRFLGNEGQYDVQYMNMTAQKFSKKNFTDQIREIIMSQKNEQ